MIFNFPDVGEGIHEGVIVNILKKEGDQVKEDEPIIEVETDKAVVEIPSPTHGVIKKHFYKVGDTAIVHEPLCEIETEDSEKKETVKEPADSGNVVGALEDADQNQTNADPLDFSNYKPSFTAKESHKKTLPKSKIASESKFRFETPEYGTEIVEPTSNVRKTIAKNMMQSFSMTAQVTHIDQIDVTNLVKKRADLKPQAEKEGVKLTYLSFIIQAIIKACQDYPKFNAAYDHQNENIIFKKYINLGIAVDTENGLLVPVIKQAEKLELFELAKKIVEISEKASTRKISPQDLQDSTITITNYGSIGGKFATPVLNYPNLANIGIGKFEQKLTLNEQGQIHEKTILPISITYDHQIIDGADTAKFCNKIAEYLN